MAAKKISIEDLKRIKQAREQNPLKWDDLRLEKVYTIQKVETIKTKFGDRKIMDLQTEGEEPIRVWAPDSVAKALSGYKPGKTVLASFGKKKFSKNPGQENCDFIVNT